MIVYHFLPAEFALDDIQNGRIKIAEVDSLNDPFDLWCVYQRDRRLRHALRAWKKQFASKFGMVCFCKGWHNPLLWSHYADHHRGICLGFEVGGSLLTAVEYVDHRPKLNIPPTVDDSYKLLFTKFRGWSYEQELREYSSLNKPDPATGLYFRNFDDGMKLRDAIAGPLCDVSEPRIRRALRLHKGRVRVRKARLAFGTFRVVENEKGFRLFGDPRESSEEK